MIFTDEVSMGNGKLLNMVARSGGAAHRKEAASGPRLLVCCWSRASCAGFLVRGASPSSEGEVAAYGHQPSQHTV